MDKNLKSTTYLLVNNLGNLVIRVGVVDTLNGRSFTKRLDSYRQTELQKCA